MDETHFDIHARGKSSRDKNIIKIYFDKRAVLAFGLKTTILRENQNEIRVRFRLILQEKKLEKCQ